MEILDVLKSLAFTEYEGKAYLALLSGSPATGYAVAKNSGVPRSKIYEVLDNLTARGDILASPGNPPLYCALPPKALIASRKAQAEENYLLAEKLLDAYKVADEDTENIWNITGQESILAKAHDCIQNAKKIILLEAWAEDFAELANDLQMAVERGVDIKIISYGNIMADFADVYPHAHGSAEEITDEYGGRWIVLSVDDGEIVAGKVSDGKESRAAWTRHPGLVMPITEVIIHDLYLAEIIKSHRESLEKSFGKNLENLRRKFSVHKKESV